MERALGAGGSPASDRATQTRVWVIAAGKAASAMAAGAAGFLGDRVRGGLVVGSQVDSLPPSPLGWVCGGHPVPTADSERAGRRALEIVRAVPNNEALLFLWSGGASALMAVPAEGVTLEDKQRTTQQLLRAGADIETLNAVRKHLSAIKGGHLAAAARAPFRTLAISDVVGDDLSVIASGPTVGDASTFAQALDALHRHGGPNLFPARVFARFVSGANGHLEETPKPRDPCFARREATVIGGRADAMRGAAEAAAALGYEVVRIEPPVVGEAREAAVTSLAGITRLVRSRSAGGRPLCVVSAGETTVRVVGRGRGGRNQEFALALVEHLSSLGGAVACASVGTDGVDGPTDAAGAIADSSSATRAGRAGLAPARFLEDNDAYAFFAAIGDLIHTGPTGTNVGDLQVTLLA